jgi:hypothetical protein
MGKRGNTSIYTDAQWQWVADRYTEGYTKMALAKFLQVDYSTLWHHLCRMGVERDELPPLSDRMKEFNALE